MTTSPPDPQRNAAALTAAPVGSSRVGAAFRLAIAAAFAAVAALLAYVIHLPPFPTCAFKLWTGVPCPGCGMTRSVLHLAHGEVLESLRFHPLGVFVGAFVVAMAFGAARSLATGRDPVWEWFEDRGAPMALGFVVALIVLWVVRTFVVPGWAPDPIGPAIFSFPGR